MSKGKKYVIRFFDDEYVIRPLNVGEYRTISMIDGMEEKQLAILKAGVITPPITSLDTILSGIAETLVLQISNLTDINESSMATKVAAERDRLGVTDDMLSFKLEIVKYLNYTPRQVDEMSIDDFVEAIVLVEAITNKPLVASGKDDGVRAKKTSISEESALESADPKDRVAMEQVANKNAIRLQQVYLMKKKAKYDNR